jgi:hypothetical protein
MVYIMGGVPGFLMALILRRLLFEIRRDRLCRFRSSNDSCGRGYFRPSDPQYE